ncbi:phosphatidylinositol 3-kinase 2-like [Schistocerca cancellata]|uniref:phosphatidylinositol 3-kinase 2-like n=1 Tax=Schistocerca cancellata TaxID=274614 RepID=UPI002118BEDC|nr:phosphatidylinositol 3-kinase 2-like [Schistocerca cancellata]
MEAESAPALGERPVSAAAQLLHVPCDGAASAPDTTSNPDRLDNDVADNNNNNNNHRASSNGDDEERWSSALSERTCSTNNNHEPNAGPEEFTTQRSLLRQASSPSRLGLVVAGDENLNTYRNSNAGQNCAVGRAPSQLSEAELEPLFGSTVDEEQGRRETPSDVVERRVASSRLLRRRTDPLDAASLLMPLPRDYRDALSSLLWQPYDCRSDDDAAPALLASSASSSPSTSSSEASVAAAPLLALRRWPADEAAALPSLPAGAAVGGGRGCDQLPFGCLQCCGDSSRAACPRDMLVNVPAPPPPPPQQAAPSTVLAPSSSSSPPPPQPESVSVVVNSGSFPVVNVTNVRTFTSTEAQTDDFGDVPAASREARAAAAAAPGGSAGGGAAPAGRRPAAASGGPPP